MDLQLIKPDGWSNTAAYSHGVIGSGKILSIAGQLGMSADRTIISDSFSKQTEQALRNVVEVLKSANAEPNRLIQLTWYVTDINAFRSQSDEVAKHYGSTIGRHLPTMVMVEVGGLVDPAAKVEISGLALLPFEQFETPQFSAAEEIALSGSERIWKAIEALSDRINSIEG